MTFFSGERNSQTTRTAKLCGSCKSTEITETESNQLKIIQYQILCFKCGKFLEMVFEALTQPSTLSNDKNNLFFALLIEPCKYEKMKPFSDKLARNH